MPPFPCCGNCYNKSSYNPKTGAQLLCFRLLPVGNLTHRHQLLRIKHVLVAYGVSLYMGYSDYVGMYIFTLGAPNIDRTILSLTTPRKWATVFCWKSQSYPFELRFICSPCTWVYMLRTVTAGLPIISTMSTLACDVGVTMNTACYKQLAVLLAITKRKQRPALRQYSTIQGTYVCSSKRAPLANAHTPASLVWSPEKRLHWKAPCRYCWRKSCSS